jgi:hypothetical protein
MAYVVVLCFDCSRATFGSIGGFAADGRGIGSAKWLSPQAARGLFAGEVALDRIEATLDDLADNVRGHEVHAAGSFRESRSDAL